MSVQHEFNPQTIKLIIGLGNAGKNYVRTRHNAGFLFLDSLTSNEFREEPKFKALMSEIRGQRAEDREQTPEKSIPASGFRLPISVLLAKPTTMMNLSGDSVQLIANFYKIKPEEILVAHDDLDIQFGKYKIQFDKGPRVHNGVNDIENRLGTTKFWRLRIGIENRGQKSEARDQRTEDKNQQESSKPTTHYSQHITGRDYVLGKFSQEELQILGATFEEISDNLQ